MSRSWPSVRELRGQSPDVKGAKKRTADSTPKGRYAASADASTETRATASIELPSKSAIRAA